MSTIVGQKPQPAPEAPTRQIPGISDRAREEAAARLVGQRRPEPPAEDLPEAA
jgi:hypothetical protein